MVRAALAGVWCVLVLLVAACGGADKAAEAQALRAQPARAAAALTPSALMDWAQGQYPQLFPGNPANDSYDVYTYRAYPGNTYLGVAVTGLDVGGVYVWSPLVFNGELTRVGTLAGFTCTVSAQNCEGSITGTAAAGAPIAGATVTLKDSANNSATATTSAAGTYTFSTSGMAAPFLLQVSTANGTTLYSVTAETGAAVANLTPLADLVVRSWYGVQGVSAAAAFANPAAAPPPSQFQAGVVAEAVLATLQLALNDSAAGISAPLELVNKPFTANHSGLDEVLDRTRATYGAGATLTVSGSAKQQVSMVGYETSASVMTVDSTIVAGTNTSSSSIRAFVPVQPAQVAAWNEIAATLAAFSSLVNTKGGNLASAEVLPYLDPDLLDHGLNRAQFAAGLVDSFGQGQSVTLELRRMASLDLATGRAEATLRVNQTLGAQSESEDMVFFFRKVAGTWTLSGDRQLADANIYAEARINQGAYTQGNGPSINAHVSTVQGDVSTVTVVTTGGGISMTRGSTSVDGSGVLLDSFLGNTGPMAAGSLPDAGTLFAVTLVRSNGPSATMTVALNASTTEGVPLTSPTGSTLADAHLGGSLGVSWALPSTYAVARVHLSALVFTGDQNNPSTFQCESEQPILGATATAGTLNIPATCNGLPVASVNINLSVTGTNGERSQTIYMLRN